MRKLPKKELRRCPKCEYEIADKDLQTWASRYELKFRCRKCNKEWTETSMQLTDY